MENDPGKILNLRPLRFQAFFLLQRKEQSIRIYLLSTGFPHSLKVKGSCETFLKLKWYKAKKQLPFELMGKFLSAHISKKKSYQIIPNMLHYVQFYAKCNTLTSSLRLFWYLRTLLANGRAK